MEMKYSEKISDMLVRIYNKMVVENLEMTANGAYQADRMISIGTASQKFYDKFISDLEYIKELSKKQPVITITFRPLFYSEKEGIIELELQQETLKTFDVIKVLEFIEKYEDKRKYNFEFIVIKDVDVLFEPYFSKDELIKNFIGE
jgi:hypothetical protein